MPKSQQGTIPLTLVLIAAVGVIIYLLVSSTFPFKDKLFNTLYPKKVSKAVGASKVTVQNGKLYVDGTQFMIKGINYIPSAIGSDQSDTSAPQIDIPKIAAMGANTIGTYNTSKFEWGQWRDAGSNDVFYANLATAAEANNLKIIVGYFSNQAIDWTDPVRVGKVTSQYQNLILKAKDKPSTLIYMIGNEIFEKLSSDVQRLSYAKWIGQMVDWTHASDPNHPVTYADNDQLSGVNYLKTYAPNLDIYSANNYVWSSTSELTQAFEKIMSLWPNKAILLHEWGVDSFDVPTWTENQTAQANRVTFLLPVIDIIYSNSAYPLIGHLLFEYSDDWSKLGTPSSQTPDQGWAWGCKTSFDAKCNEEYWGITKAVSPGAASSRVLKPAYYALQKAWAPTPTPSQNPSPSSSPSPTPTSVPLDTVPPVVSITSPANGAYVFRNTSITTSATATDNIGVTKAEFRVDGSLICTKSTPPYSCAWKAPKKTGVKNIEARAYDAAGNSATSKISVYVR